MVVLDRDGLVRRASGRVQERAGPELHLLRRERVCPVERLLERYRVDLGVELDQADGLALVDELDRRLLLELEEPPPLRLGLTPVVEEEVRQHPPLGGVDGV